MKGSQVSKGCSCCIKRTKKRSPEEFRKLMNRLSRVEGQLKGVKNMLENDAYCPEVLMQVSAITSALNAFNKELLSAHIRTCVADDIRSGKEETLDELLSMLQKLMH